MNVPTKIYINLTPNTTQAEAKKDRSNEAEARQKYELSNKFLTFLKNMGEMPITLDNDTIIEVPFETTQKNLIMAQSRMRDFVNAIYYDLTNIHPDLKPLVKGKSLVTPDHAEYIAELSNTICSDGNTSHYNSMRSDFLADNKPGIFTMIGMFGEEIWFVLTFFINIQERNYTFSINGICANNDLHNKIKGSGIGVRMILELFKQFNSTLEGNKFEYCTLSAVPKAVKWWSEQFGFINNGDEGGTGLYRMGLKLDTIPFLSAPKVPAPSASVSLKPAPKVPAPKVPAPSASVSLKPDPSASAFESITGKRSNTSGSSNKLKKITSATLDPLDLKDFFTLEELRGQLFEGHNEPSDKGNWPGSDEDEDEDEGGGLRKSKTRHNKQHTIKKLKRRKTRIMKNKKKKTKKGRKRSKRNP
jgi:hypothetical protein